MIQQLILLNIRTGPSGIERFINIVGEDRVVAGTDCGFGTFAGFGAVDPEIAYAKLSTLSRCCFNFIIDKFGWVKNCKRMQLWLLIKKNFLSDK